MEMAARAGGCNYIIGRVKNEVTRSKYGKRLPQNRTSEIRPARSLVHTAGKSLLSDSFRRREQRLIAGNSRPADPERVAGEARGRAGKLEARPGGGEQAVEGGQGDPG